MSDITESDIQLACRNWCNVTDFSETTLTYDTQSSDNGLVPFFFTLLDVHHPLKYYAICILF